jgi:hypothetical protein
MQSRLSADGLRVFDQWRTERCRSADDEMFVAEILRTVADGSWGLRWYSSTNPDLPGVVSLQPRDGLYVHIRMWADQGEFTIVSITDIDVDDEE